MNSYIQWVLRQEHQGCSAPIPVPSPIHTGIIADLEGLPKGERKAAFLCSACGLVTLYSDASLENQVLGKPDPYLQNSLALVYIEAECADNSCESRTPINAVWDVAGGKIATTVPMNEWRFDEAVKCECGHQVVLDPTEAHPFYRAEMPF
jgi:hypothetical protein